MSIIVQVEASGTAEAVASAEAAHWGGRPRDSRDPLRRHFCLGEIDTRSERWPRSGVWESAAIGTCLEIHLCRLLWVEGYGGVEAVKDRTLEKSMAVRQRFAIKDVWMSVYFIRDEHDRVKIGYASDTGNVADYSREATPTGWRLCESSRESGIGRPKYGCMKLTGNIACHGSLACLGAENGFTTSRTWWAFSHRPKKSWTNYTTLEELVKLVRRHAQLGRRVRTT